MPDSASEIPTPLQWPLSYVTGLHMNRNLTYIFKTMVQFLKVPLSELQNRDLTCFTCRKPELLVVSSWPFEVVLTFESAKYSTD